MKSPIRILAVDGGGVGGIIPARILDRLTATHPNVVARADIVAGTSTGGLIALGLACGKTPAQLCDVYLRQAKNIFSHTNRRFEVEWPVLAKYRPAGLREAATEIAGTNRLGDLTVPHVFIPVTAVHRPDKSHRPAGVFLSTAFRLTGDDALEKYASAQWSCVDVALATSAAPTYFPAHRVKSPDPKYPGDWICWDGGVVANNPSLAAVGEVFRLDQAVRMSGAREHQGDSPDVRVLSLGTGYRDKIIEAADWGLLECARPVVGALMDTSVGSTAFLLRQLLGKRAIRVNVPLSDDYDMDDPTVMDRLDAQARDFAANSLGTVRQTDETVEDLHQWLKTNWIDGLTG